MTRGQIESAADEGDGMSRRHMLTWAAAASGAAGLLVTAAMDQAAAAIPAPRPTIAAPVRAKPVFKVRDLLPRAPSNAVALTIDDGPHPYWTPRVLSVLHRYGVRATFSLVGVEVYAHRGLVRRIVADGHAICNHTMTHPQPFARRTPAQIDQEITRAQSVIVDAAGIAPRLFRSPGGSWSPEVLSAVARRGMIPIDWDVDPKDWSRPGTSKIVNRLAAARPGDILLCHDGGGNRSQTVHALRAVLPQLKAQGYTFVTL
jgi:peptidoglycan/xylan/chitin deacetylase (PgdA/CDA1 family)